ncbi:peroxide stress protein YaaA [Flavobacterium sp.]|jgi:cytoplasmic iron level regulating protein YaaA (DUF328/UPF0246 family)|uniref:peroxide stress protein YaaA n=1 Tax=Flavobacterium sp. TaxID=239 RepID=UPI0037C13EE9
MLAENKIKKLFESFPFESLRDTSKNKLLIIACSDRKIAGNEICERNYFNSESYKYLKALRELRRFNYIDYINSNSNEYLMIKDINGNGNLTSIDSCYFINSLKTNTPNLKPAVERYDGIFYSYDLKNLYFKKNRESNLHILIVSGLYGILEFRDGIIDYHFNIKNGPKIWSNCLTNTINQYISENEIDNDSVFYSLSDEYLKNITPNSAWKNIWIKNGGLGSLQTSAKFLKEYFLPNL